MGKILVFVAFLMLPLAGRAQAPAERCASMHDPVTRFGCHDSTPADEIPASAAQCRAVTDPNARLACYDRARPPVARAGRVLPATYCLTVTDQAHKLACYRASYAAYLDKTDPARCFTLPEQEQPTCFDALQPPPVAVADKPSNWQIVVREKGLPSMQDLEQPATIGFVRSGGKTTALFKAAVAARWRRPNSWGWQPFLAAEVIHDLSDSARVNTKAAGVGAHGTWGFPARGVAFDTAAQFKLLKDSEAHTRSSQLVVDNVLVIDRLARGYAFSPEDSYRLLPSFGLLREDLRETGAGSDSGDATSAYVALRLAYWPRIAPFVQINLFAQRFVDVDVSSSLDKRYHSFYQVSADWHLYDPRDAKRKFTPIIGLAREYGTNPMESMVKRNSTSLALRFKFDYP